MIFAFVVIATLIVVFLSIPIASVMGMLALILDQAYTNGRLSLTFGGFIWEASTQFVLLAVPLFILLGEIVLRAGITAQMYTAVSQWLSWLPGGLMHANIGTATVFSATSGSSVATTATIGVVAYPEIERRGYNESLFLGSIAAGGSLGVLIPPSVVLIVYGVLTQTSIPELYLAGIVPGLMLAGFFSLVIAVICLIKKDGRGQEVKTSWSARVKALPDLIPPLLLFFSVVGTIYAGLATPTEAASLGVCAALLLAWFKGKLSVRMLLSAFEGTVRTTSMVMLIIFAAMLLNIVVGFMGVLQAASEFLGTLGLTPMQTILMVIVFYLVLGMFMETFSMMLTTIGLVFPIVTSMGFDPVWFGILVTLLMEIALITPPIGVNLFVVQGVRSRGGSFRDVCVGAAPFVLAMLLLIALMIVFPDIALWLPRQFY
jgi:C4-dicarboxylate transporter DctM subunit